MNSRIASLAPFRKGREGKEKFHKLFNNYDRDCMQPETKKMLDLNLL